MVVTQNEYDNDRFFAKGSFKGLTRNAVSFIIVGSLWMTVMILAFANGSIGGSTVKDMERGAYEYAVSQIQSLFNEPAIYGKDPITSTAAFQESIVTYLGKNNDGYDQYIVESHVYTRNDGKVSYDIIMWNNGSKWFRDSLATSLGK